MKNLKFVGIFVIAFIMNVNGVWAIDCDEVLKRGDTGSAVYKLQENLNDKIKCNLDVDGVFGDKTYACIIKFQDRYNLDVDGIFGKKTCNKLNKVDAINEKIDDFNIDGNKNIIVKKNNINIRDNYGNIIKQANLGDIFNYVSVINKNGDKWYKIILDDEYGYINYSLVTRKFIVVDISMQRLVYYKSGKVVLDANVVTGMKNSHDTPVGSYVLNINNKEKNRTLRGNNDDGSKYAAHVNYWMPFIMDRGIGFHDASWRDDSQFNDATYIYSGSHGCVNMKSEDAKSLYNSLNSNVTVIVRD